MAFLAWPFLPRSGPYRSRGSRVTPPQSAEGAMPVNTHLRSRCVSGAESPESVTFSIESVRPAASALCVPHRRAFELNDARESAAACNNQPPRVSLKTEQQNGNRLTDSGGRAGGRGRLPQQCCLALGDKAPAIQNGLQPAPALCLPARLLPHQKRSSLRAGLRLSDPHIFSPGNSIQAVFAHD
jgi:hypothetical protein